MNKIRQAAFVFVCVLAYCAGCFMLGYVLAAALDSNSHQAAKVEQHEAG